MLFYVAQLHILYFPSGASRPCALRSFPDGQVCVCNATYCDTLDEPLIPSSQDQVIVVTTGPVRINTLGLRISVAFILFSNQTVFKDGRRLAVTNGKFYQNDHQVPKFNGTNNIVDATITIDEHTKYQTIIGFGGAHTGTVAYLLEQLPQSLQDFIYESYYSQKKGIGYTLTRMAIGGCDFDLSPWAYNERPLNDKNLSNFTKLDARDLQKVSVSSACL